MLGWCTARATEHWTRKTFLLPLPALQSLSSSLYWQNLALSQLAKEKPDLQNRVLVSQSRTKRMCVEIKDNKSGTRTTHFIIVIK